MFHWKGQRPRFKTRLVHSGVHVLLSLQTGPPCQSEMPPQPHLHCSVCDACCSDPSDYSMSPRGLSSIDSLSLRGHFPHPCPSYILFRTHCSVTPREGTKELCQAHPSAVGVQKCNSSDFFFLIEVQLIHYVVLISAVQQSDSVIYTLFPILQVASSEGKGELVFYSLSWVGGSQLCLM